jgi:hypothetical protein
MAPHRSHMHNRRFHDAWGAPSHRGAQSTDRRRQPRIGADGLTDLAQRADGGLPLDRLDDHRRLAGRAGDPGTRPLPRPALIGAGPPSGRRCVPRRLSDRGLLCPHDRCLRLQDEAPATLADFVLLGRLQFLWARRGRAASAPGTNPANHLPGGVGAATGIWSGPPFEFLADFLCKTGIGTADLTGTQCRAQISRWLHFPRLEEQQISLQPGIMCGLQ